MSMFRMVSSRLRVLCPALVFGCLAFALSVLTAQAQQGVTVFAAASLQTALDQLDKDWQAAGHAPLVIAYAGSATLAQQIDKGAPADLFISADTDWMDWLVSRKQIATDAPLTVLGNRLVLIAPNMSTNPAPHAPPFVNKGDDLAAVLKSSRLAMGDPRSVPAGKYGKAALQYLGLWDGLSASVAPFDNVRMALNFVARREAALGIVYASDAVAEPRVKIIGQFAPDSHPPILYRAAVPARATNPEATHFLAFLRSETAKKRFVDAGFVFLAGAAR